MKFTITKTDKKIEFDSAKFWEYLGTLKSGNYYFPIKKIGKSKTYPQIKYWFGVVIRAYCDEQGILPYEKEVIYEVHTTLKKMMWGVQERKLPSGKTIEYVMSMSKAESDEMGFLIDGAIKFLASHGIIVPTPNEISDQELEKYYRMYKT